MPSADPALDQSSAESVRQTTGLARTYLRTHGHDPTAAAMALAAWFTAEVPHDVLAVGHAVLAVHVALADAGAHNGGEVT